MSRILGEGARICAYPEQIDELRKLVPEIFHLPCWVIEDLYMEFSDREYSAQWMGYTPEVIQEFRVWLMEA